MTRPPRSPPTVRCSHPRTPPSRRTTAASRSGVFQRYSGAGGIQEEIIDQAAAYPRIAEVRTIGQTVNGQDITAIRVTKNPGRERPGKRPTTVYLAAQHAREWITPEMVTRLLDHVLTGYGTDPAITRLVNDNELWFIPVANPDGYDYTPRRRTALAQEPPGQQRRRTDHPRRRRRSQPELPDPLGLRQRGFVAELRQRDLPRRRVRCPSPRTRRSTPCSGRSRPSSSSTTTRPPSCCCTASAGRWRRRHRTT